MGVVEGAFSTPWNPFSLRGIRRVLETEKPDIMHVHNTFPLLSPAIFRAARGLNTATVLTLHNYRTFCAAGIPMRNGQVCTECLDSLSSLPSLKYGCYRNSRLATLPMVAMIELHRKLKTWKNDVDAFIALTEFQKEKMTNAGLPRDQILVKPHFYNDPPNPLPINDRELYVVYIGRLGDEKGVGVLLKAWEIWGDDAPELKIVGDGPLLKDLCGFVKETGIDNKVSFYGQLPFQETQSLLQKSMVLILPSLCFEGFPMTIREAFAHGVPVVASDLGALPFIVKDGHTGILFPPGNAYELYHATREVVSDPVRNETLAMNARAEFDKKYTAGTNHEIMLNIYSKAMITRTLRK